MSISTAFDKDRLYFRTDSHWSGEGCYFAYRLLCERIGIGPHVRPSLPNRRNDILDRVAVNPFIVREGGTHPAATMRMTAVTIHLGEERLALRQLVGVLLVILALLRTRGDRRSAPWRKRHHRGRDRRLRADGIGMNVADLALAGGEGQKRGSDCDESRNGPLRA